MRCPRQLAGCTLVLVLSCANGYAPVRRQDLRHLPLAFLCTESDCTSLLLACPLLSFSMDSCGCTQARLYIGCVFKYVGERANLNVPAKYQAQWYRGYDLLTQASLLR